MSGEFFTFADEQEWGTPRLEERYAVLDKNDPKHLSTERRGAVVREMCHIAFEGLQRKREINQRNAEINDFDARMGVKPDTQLTLPGIPKLPWRKQGQ